MNDPLQALAFFVGSNLARNAGVVHRRHVDQKTSGQRDVTGNARAFFADRFLGNLDQDFLPFFQQVADLRDLTDCRGAGICRGPPPRRPRRPPRPTVVAGTAGARCVYAGC